MLPVLHIQVLFFDDENKRAEFVRHLCPEVMDVGPEIRVKGMTEKELLKEALTREQRAQIVETFIRHAFSKVQRASGCSPHPLSCHSAAASCSAAKCRQIELKVLFDQTSNQCD